MSLDAKRIINGTYGMCYINGDEVSEITGLKANISLNYEEVPIAGNLAGGKKLSGMTKNGSLTMHKVNSRMAKLIANDIKKGITTDFTIVSKLDAPDSYGAERVVLYGVKFSELTLADWSAKQNGSINQPFTFDDFDFLDMIEEV